MVIGEAIVSSFFQVLFDKLASLGTSAVDNYFFAQREGINTALLNRWKRMLVTIKAVLDDAEDKQLSGNHLVKLWLDDVRDLTYDLEDLLDEFKIEVARAMLEVESRTSRGQTKRKYISFVQDQSSGSNPNLPSLSETKVKEINDRLEEIVTRKTCVSLGENVVDRSNYTNKRLPSSSLPEPWFFGRQKEEAEILELLTSAAKHGNKTLNIVPIVGMGGVGKTALAQRLYNDAKVSNYFEIRAWVCVSEAFDVLNITKTILQSFTGLSCDGKDLNWLQVMLKHNLSGKRFLVVLDDVWNENYREWIALLKPFEIGAKGSNIIVTTRNLPVVSITGASPYPLEALSLDNCTSLLAFHALGVTNFERHPDLAIIGKKIARKCKGLPLAATILGGLLYNKGNPDEWEAILNNKIWESSMGENGELLQVLKLSYIHLPSYLKRCFAYCAIFPKDYEIERDELVLLWIAEGFFDGQKTKENILKLGRNHFNELVSRSFLQQSNVNTSKFSMHDLLNDLAKSIAGGTCFSSGESQLSGNEDDASFEKARYASFISSGHATSRSLRAYTKMKVLRTLMLLRVGFSKDSRKFYISSKVLVDLLKKLKYLRVFLLCHCYIKEVPDCIGDLKYLRYLNFSYTDIEKLPESIATLCKLQALILRGCQKLSMLPQGITKLDSLQFLDIRDTGSLKKIPLSIGNLNNLTILSKFVVGPEEGSQLNQLKNLAHLQGELFISELHKVEDVKDAIGANLFEKKGLSNLFLCWHKDFGNLRNEQREERVLHSLQPPTNLENLTISYYGGAKIPPWLDGLSYSKIVSLCLSGCPNVESLPSLGQLPSLRELSLQGLCAVSMIGSEFYGTKRPFSSLMTLEFKEMPAWIDWSQYDCGREEVPFSCLHHLVVWHCPALIEALPCRLDHLVKLEVRSCPHLNISTTSVVCLPSLQELYLENCKKELLNRLASVASLTKLKIEKFEELVYFDHGFMRCLVKLKNLHIKSCKKLTYLWQAGHEMLNLTGLQKIVIESCPQFISFVAGDKEIELPCNLESMELRDCERLEKLPSMMHTLNSLSHLEIDNCPELTGLIIPSDDPNNNHPTSNLESLQIIRGDSLTSFMFAKSRLAALKRLSIRGCKEVKSLEEIVVESLEYMAIVNCKNLGSLPQSLQRLSKLTHLEIIDCPALEMECFPPLPITLSCLRLYNCPNINSLPNQWHDLTSLQTLDIWRCKNIKCFPKGGLPPNLRILKISGCENLKQPVREWHLQVLTSLESLTLDGSMGGEGEKAWFPSEDKDAWSVFFPYSLISLRMRNMWNMEGLSSGLSNHLSSLQHLWIGDCPKLNCLPEDGLPSSLQVLDILGSKILKDRCAKFTGDYWEDIQEIPHISIGDVRIQ